MNENQCCCSSGGCCGEATTPTVPTQLTFQDVLGSWKVRFGIGRMNYKVNPGLYAVGSPDKEAPALVSANYKLTFDSLRKELSGISCWLLILDTKGVNVWCAAGKGTFGTAELLNRISLVNLPEAVSHRTLILPQLGAPGINTSEVKLQSGFSVEYGPVQAKDIKAFLQSGNHATAEMRTVPFTMLDRLVLTPVEVISAAQKLLTAFGVLFMLNLFAVEPFNFMDFIAYAGTVLIGALITPILLPFIPGRAFSFKGGLLGILWAAVTVWWGSLSLLSSIGYVLLLPSISAYLAMNFTGSSTYTSPSGVLKEMKIALPIIVTASIAGAVLILLSHIFGI